MTLSRKSRAAVLSVASNATLVVLKLVVGVLSQSVSVLSEAIHSANDLVAALIAFASTRVSDRPSDEEHPYRVAGSRLSALSERQPFFRMTRSLRATLWLALGGGLAIQLAAVYWTLLGGVLQTVPPLSLQDWQRVAVVAFAALLVVEAAKGALPRLKVA